MDAMLRSCGEAPSSSACEMTGNRCATLGTWATSLIRARAPISRPPPGRSCTPASRSALTAWLTTVG